MLNFDAMRPAKRVEFRDINEFTHGAIRFTGIKHHLALKVYSLHHQFRQFPDSEFLAGTDVDVAVADLTKFWDSTAPTRRMIAIYGTICTCSVMDA